MRKIERLMNAAIDKKVFFELNNTAVYYNEQTNKSLVRLHDNLIAVIDHSDGMKVKVNESMFSDWPTSTTAGRLRALGVAASIKGGMAAIDGVVL